MSCSRISRARLVAPLVLALVAACAPAPGVSPPAGTTPGGTVSARGPLGGVTFRPVSAANARLVAGQPVAGTGAEADAMAASGRPAAAPAPASVAKGGGDDGNRVVAGAYSGNVYGYYGWGWYYGGSEENALIAFEEGDAPGATGPFPQVATDVAAPVVAAWATDARLVQSSATLKGDGTPYPAASPGQGGDKIMMPGPMPGPYYGDGGWRLVYVSSSRKEVLQFLVRPDKTIVLRQAWGPLNLDATRVTVSSTDAINRLTGAIRDRGFVSEEERTGKDYFLGFAFEPPTIWTGDGQRVEVRYDVPADARWEASLQQILGKLVWQLSFWKDGPIVYADARGGGATGVAVAAPAVAPAAADDQTRPAPECPPPDPGFYENQSGSGMVDAATGTVIRFSRPTTVYYTPYTPEFCVSPKPEPSEKPSPSPSASPTPTPSPSASPSPSPSPTASP